MGVGVNVRGAQLQAVLCLHIELLRSVPRLVQRDRRRTVVGMRIALAERHHVRRQQDACCRGQ